MVETQAEEILYGADKQDVSLLIISYPFGATTHIDIVLRVCLSGIPLCMIHNTSIMNAIGVCGLQLYNFGQTNMGLGLHMLVLLDIKAKEQSEENLAWYRVCLACG
ncbi:hypothetical protein F5141DRAFT_1139159 [Pisolithus sp. B1]|nr:hypothetical protein F5141DRAFT_1139159 [Pisolithus sp. B1]